MTDFMWIAGFSLASRVARVGVAALIFRLSAGQVLQQSLVLVIKAIISNLHQVLLAFYRCAY
jgi:hypothetical protein